MFPYFEEASESPPAAPQKCTPHWHRCINAGKLDWIGPYITSWIGLGPLVFNPKPCPEGANPAHPLKKTPTENITAP